MSPMRRLAYRLMSLPYLVALGVLRDLGLLTREDTFFDDVAMYRAALVRAKERGQLTALWHAANAKHEPPKQEESPF